MLQDLPALSGVLKFSYHPTNLRFLHFTQLTPSETQYLHKSSSSSYIHATKRGYKQQKSPSVRGMQREKEGPALISHVRRLLPTPFVRTL
ncbi:hypothetical protein BDDG_12039 [Blastomyces dermatitidis ATCC 18188]|uniref:Uncharacterized protein n=1 Tax=Ajellomyces dermatitidis (strain ATCC 18188 / CBS 674.68) TaxID=653446 RepID=A0A0J9HE21_AJEDA|nr:hypothetical protein BDDG_12039 [Blastomyces dermatitidis ATCC 18188]